MAVLPNKLGLQKATVDELGPTIITESMQRRHKAA